MVFARPTWPICSNKHQLPVVDQYHKPHLWTVMGQRAFSYAGLHACNALPSVLQNLFNLESTFYMETFRAHSCMQDGEPSIVKFSVHHLQLAYLKPHSTESSSHCSKLHHHCYGSGSNYCSYSSWSLRCILHGKPLLILGRMEFHRSSLPWSLRVGNLSSLGTARSRVDDDLSVNCLRVLVAGFRSDIKFSRLVLSATMPWMITGSHLLKTIHSGTQSQWRLSLNRGILLEMRSWR